MKALLAVGLCLLILTTVMSKIGQKVIVFVCSDPDVALQLKEEIPSYSLHYKIMFDIMNVTLYKNTTLFTIIVSNAARWTNIWSKVTTRTLLGNEKSICQLADEALHYNFDSTNKS